MVTKSLILSVKVLTRSMVLLSGFCSDGGSSKHNDKCVMFS